jgi:hypothetical protein
MTWGYSLSCPIIVVMLYARTGALADPLAQFL